MSNTIYQKPILAANNPAIRKWILSFLIVSTLLTAILSSVAADAVRELVASPTGLPDYLSVAGKMKADLIQRATQSASLSLNKARRGHSATTLSDMRVLIVGGENHDGPVIEAEVLDPKARTLSVVSNLITSRVNHTATLLPDGRVLVVGGYKGKELLQTTEIFDPKADSFSRGPRLNFGRAGHSATMLTDNLILIAGGRPDGTAEVFDINAGSFTLLSELMNGPRSLHGAVRLKNGDALIAGGIGPDDKPLDTAELFETKRLRFKPINTWMYTERVRPQLLVLPDGKVQVIGGDEKGTMEMYDPAGACFRAFASLISTADTLSQSAMMQARTRTAFIDGSKKQKKQKAKEAPVADGASQAMSDELPYRADYTSTEIPQFNQAVIVGGVDEDGRFLQSVELVKSAPASLTTDRVDYPPDAGPIISGTGWLKDETVVIHRLEVMTGNRIQLYARADDDGGLAYGGLPPSSHQVGTYVLTAIGERSGYAAQAIYRSGPALDQEKAGKPPAKVKFLIPLSGADEGTVQSYAGPFKYNISRVKAGLVTGKSEDVRTQGRIDFPSVDVDWSNQCINIAFLDDLCTSGHLSFNGFLEVTARIDFGAIPNPACCACEALCFINPFCDDCSSVCDLGSCSGRLPDISATLRIVVNFDASIINEFTLHGTVFNKNDIAVFPLGAVDIPPTIETGGFGFRAILGLIGGIEMRFDEPMKFRTSLSLGANTDVRLSAGTSGVDADFDITNEHASASFEMIELGSTCLQLSLGPGFTGTIYDLTCSSLIGLNTRPVAGFIEGCLNADKVDPTCEKFNVDINGGLKRDFKISIGCDSASLSPISIDEPYFRDNIADFDLGVFKDTAPPTINVPGDLVQSTDPGKCTASVSYAATADDYCSGVSAFSCNPPSGATFQKGTTTVTCNAVDQKNNHSSSTFNVTINDTERPKIAACQTSITKSTDPGQCSAVTAFNVPSATDNCSVNVSCSPPSGAAYPKGQTTVTCTATDTSGNTDSCTFTVTVNDTEKPTITCLPNQTRLTAGPGTTSTVVNYPAPANSDNCSVSVIACAPPSGSVFSVGVTTVACTATDTSLNKAQCSFTVTVFDVSLQDDSAPNVELLYNSITGDYRFCCSGVMLTGTGTVTRQGSTFSLQHFSADRRVLGKLDDTQKKGTASVKFGAASCTVTDRDTRNNTITCQ